ncbi:ligand-binding sensor domain-containing protein [Pedobacter africanus]|uniref:Ligand-binding sensor domain-containing protein n=1 Tax=Pedobacter africanus TaxID=151894 RepID=A0ACC6KXI0_9SPHI|nr:two-component regulator propeller domain-containing protein [Pedobacter africanus]MDR6783905.1 ligand-binding sensor domain-containing protein [Pedobacter africanus]
MKNKRNLFYSLLIILTGAIYFPVQAQQKNDVQDGVKTKDLSPLQGPKSIVRTIKQDRSGNIWIASWEGVFKYDGKSFANITSKVSSARFFSVLEDRKGNFWFSSVGSGVYYYNGKSFRNFTTKDGLPNDRVTHVYEDKTGNIWFGTESGASRYDGKSFRNYKITTAPAPTGVDSVQVSAYQQQIPEGNWMQNDVNAIIEDKTGKIWFGTRGYTRVYDGKTFTTITRKDGKPFTNVRSIIKDKKGNIWLGGYDGLWRYDGGTFTNFTQKFVGYIYEDKKGDIWTSSDSSNDLSKVPFGGRGNTAAWTLSRYDEKSLSNKKPRATEIASKPMIFGILKDDKGNIWFGTLDGVYLYDGATSLKM